MSKFKQELYKIKKDFIKNKMLYLLVLPFIAYYVIFYYIPMYGVTIAFKDYNPVAGIMGSEWVGFKHFIEFMSSEFFGRTLKNTLIISSSLIIFGFPVPIIFALCLNELRNKYFKKAVQTITYLPHFVSIVVICGMIKTFTMDNGFISWIVSLFTGHRETLLNNPNAFVPIYVISDIWQSFGWSSIIFLSAIVGIDTELYEAARIDGAGRWQQTLHITLPGIMPTIVLMLILRLGGILNVGFEKIILLYNEGIYSTSDVISTYVYRAGFGKAFDWGLSTAVGLFNSVVNVIFLVAANTISRKVNETSLW